MATLKREKDFVIKVGALSSIPQLIACLGKPLQQFTNEWRANSRRRIVWDLRSLQPGTMNISAIATFCACALRLRQYSWSRPLAYIPKAQVQRYLYGIGFFKIVRDRDLMDFADSVIGGFEVPTFHPATQVFCIRRIAETIPDINDVESIANWKDECREKFRQQMLYSHNCRRLFYAEEVPHQLDPDIVNSILNCCAEFATNAVLWGRTDAFVAIEVGRYAFSAAVCDVGDGFLATLCEKKIGRLPRNPINDHEAAFFASIYNRRALGLFHTISSVLKRQGSVVISAGKAEIHWRPALWRRVLLTLDQNDESIFKPNMLDELLGPTVRGCVKTHLLEEGIRREWNPGLRGTRIAFKLPYAEEPA